MSDSLAGHEHVFMESGERDAMTLLLLHGTGGNEYDLLPVARAVAPDAHHLAPRGRVLENGMPRFFARHGEGLLDVEDLKARASDLAEFVREAEAEYGFDAARVIALGYSNGANVATGMLLTEPGVLAGAVLARAMPFDLDAAHPEVADGVRALLVAGRNDPYTRSPMTERLQERLEGAGASVDVHWSDAGHELTPADVDAARDWLAHAREVSA